jgi:hypothetical protein
MNAVHRAGFTEAVIGRYHAVFEDVPHPSDALEFGTKGISLRALKK